MQRAKILMWALVGLLFLAPAARAAQSDTSRAVVAIDVNLDGLAGLGMDQMREGFRAGPLTGADLDVLKQTSRFTLFMSAPESVEALAEMQGDAQPIPFELFVRIEFKNGEARKKLIDAMKEGIAEVTENGQKVFKPTKKGPPNLRLKLVGEAGVEMGTEGFMASSDKKFLSPKLEAAWSSAPKHAFRLAADLESAAALVDGAMAEAGAGAPRGVQPFLDLIPKIATIRLTLDGKDATLVSLSIDGKDEAAAGEIHEAFEGLLGMAKMAAPEGIKQMQEQAPKLAEAATAIVGALNSKKTGTTVLLNIPRPAGLGEAIQEAAGAAKEASKDAAQMNRFRQAALSVHNYFDSYRQFPFTALKNSPQTAGKLSWRVRVLPFIEETDLSTKIDAAKDFDSPANAKFAEKMPKTYGENSTSLSDIAWVQPQKPIQGFAEIVDGTSNTIMFVQHKTGMPWMDPANVTADEVVKMFESLEEGESLLVAFYDGSVHKLTRDLDVAELKKMLDPADGQVVDMSQLKTTNR